MTRIIVFQLNRNPEDMGYGAVVVEGFDTGLQEMARRAMQAHAGGNPVLAYCEELEIIVEGAE